MELRVLAVGDVVGVSGLKHLEKHLRSVKRLYGVDFCVDYLTVAKPVKGNL